MVHIRPDGTKKAYVRLTPEVDALDIANKVSLIYADSLILVLTTIVLSDRLHLNAVDDLWRWILKTFGYCLFVPLSASFTAAMQKWCHYICLS